MNRTALAALFALILAHPAAAREDASGALLQIVFRKGYDFANFDDAVMRGQNRGYTIHVRKGQMLKLKVDAPDNNVAYSVYAPGAKASRDDYRSPLVIDGTALVSHHPANEVWTVTAPSTGDYIILFEQSQDAYDAWFGGAVIVR